MIFQSADHVALFCKSVPAPAPKASVVFVHGLGEHIERYDAAFNAFAARGYSCFGFDQRGFGRSAGERGHVGAFFDYVDDLAAFIAAIVTPASAKPVFLFGHSMGSLVALAYALRQPAAIQGLLLFSCPLVLASGLVNAGEYVAEALAGMAPRLKMPNLIDPRELSDDPAIIKAFREDPLIVGTVSLNWVREFKRARQKSLLAAPRIMMPALLSHGSDDRIAAVTGAELLYGRLGGADKKLVVYDGFKHELLNHRPAERLQVLEQTFAWLDRHC